MTDEAAKLAKRKVKNETEKAQQRDEVAGEDWSYVPADVQAWLRRRAAGYAEKGEEPKAAARRAVRRAVREGRLPEP